MGCAGQQSGGFASVRERQVGVAVHGSGVSRGAAQLGFSGRGWCGPPLGPQPADVASLLKFAAANVLFPT
jgi:hypothetical protein